MFSRRLCARTCVSCSSYLLASTSLRNLTILPLTMPSLSPTMEQGKVVEWKKRVGERVDSGDSVCSIETDKATVSYNVSAEEGFMARYLADESTGPIKIGQPIALLVDEKEGIESAEVKAWKAAPTAQAAMPPKVETQAPKVCPAASCVKAEAAPACSGGHVLATPLARATASSLGMDLRGVQGTGGTLPYVTKADVLRASATAPPLIAQPAGVSPAQSAVPPVSATDSLISQPFEDKPLSMMRQVIAKRLNQSMNLEVPHYFITNECRTDNMKMVIQQLNSKASGKYKVTVNDFLIKAMARANMLVPACNSHWCGSYIREYKGVDVSVAVATPAGLITPIIRNAHLKGLAEISIETKLLSAKAKEGTLQPNEFQGGTVTISNLGGMGVQSFTAIINPPQSMILAVGSIAPKPQIRTKEDGSYELTGVIEGVMACTASFDHRVVDGAVGAQWWQAFKDTVENPLSLLL